MQDSPRGLSSTFRLPHKPKDSAPYCGTNFRPHFLGAGYDSRWPPRGNAPALSRRRTPPETVSGTVRRQTAHSVGHCVRTPSPPGRMSYLKSVLNVLCQCVLRVRCLRILFQRTISFDDRAAGSVSPEPLRRDHPQVPGSCAEEIAAVGPCAPAATETVR
jgi:hypothetical protein